MNRLCILLLLNRTVDKLVCFRGYFKGNVHERTTLFLPVVSFVWIPLSSLFVFSVCQLVRINFLFSCKYFFPFREEKKKYLLTESSLYSLQLNPTIDKLVCFYGWVNENVTKERCFSFRLFPSFGFLCLLSSFSLSVNS